MIDVVVIGHVTRDIIRRPGKEPVFLPGGTALYASLALARFGRKVAVVTKVRPEDARDLLAPLASAGVHVINKPTASSTVFENTYSGDGLSKRSQRVLSMAEPFLEEDFIGISARAVHVGSLTRDEFKPDHIKTLRASFEWVSLDAQGFLRTVVDEEVVQRPWFESHRYLSDIDILKVDDQEASLMVVERTPSSMAQKLHRLGARQVLVTLAHRGAVVAGAGQVTPIPALQPNPCTDTTGCGDTFAAAFIDRRLAGETPVHAGLFAAAASSLKIQKMGPLDASRDEVWAHLAQAALASA